MAAIDWAMVCDFAYLDRDQRLCVLGVTRQIVVPTLPHVLEHAVMVAHLVDVQPVDQIELCFRLTAAAEHGIDAQAHHVAVEVVGEYVLARVNGVTLRSEGTYLFELVINGRTVAQPVSLISADRTGPSPRVH